MQLNKKQVKALLDVISKDETRPILTHAKIDVLEDRPVLVATDSYKLAAIALSDDILPEMGELIPRDELIKWYKLASNKDYLTEADLLKMIVAEDGIGKYPEWQKLIPAENKTEAITDIRINADFLLTMQVLADCNSSYSAGMHWHFGGTLAPVISRHNNNVYIVMPLKR